MGKTWVVFSECGLAQNVAHALQPLGKWAQGSRQYQSQYP